MDEFLPFGIGVLPFGIGAALTKLFSIRKGDIPICQTRIMREGAGWPWNHQIGVHPLPDGKLELTRITTKQPDR